ncbi:hypothetical protein M0802_013121 [Mischocyttarus mexicanus]|nr:hypothetical protein M0802_013121 [Mischocyttarus mexicanus]
MNPSAYCTCGTHEKGKAVLDQDFKTSNKLIVNVGLKWIFQHGNIKEQYNATPFVGISFNNLQHEINTRHERFCCNKFFNCFLVDLKSSNFMHLSEKSDSLFRINFPIKDWFGFYCITIWIAVVDEITICRFGFYCITIWIAVVDEITICRYNFGNHYCKIDTEFLFMFINNPSYKAYFRYLLPHCDTPNTIKTQLKQFRQEIVLFEDSTAFMHVSFGRMEEFYFLDTSLFKEVFPEVRLLPFFGKASYMGHCFYHLPNLSVSSYTEEQVKHTSILIISRNK